MQNKRANTVIWLALALAPLSGQTRIDLGRQGRSVNFSGAGATKPFQTGTALPGVCTAGDTFFKTDGSPNKSLYTCAQSGAWAVVGDDGVPAAAGGADKVLSANGSAAEWRALGGDISGPPQAVQVQSIRGRAVAPNAPLSGQVLSWNTLASRWEPASVAQGSVTAGAGISVTGSVVSVDPAAVPSFLTASATVDFPAIGASGCSIQTFAFPGAVTGDAVIGGWPADMSTGIIPRILISASNTVQIQLCNMTGGTIDPPGRTYGATIVRSF